MRRSPEFIDDWLQLWKESDEVQLMDNLDGGSSLVVATQHEWFEERVIKVFTK